MKNNENLSISITGNPFIDLGFYAISEWCDLRGIEKIERTHIKKAFDDILPLYTSDPWKKDLFRIYFNSSLTHSTLNTPEKRQEKTIQLFEKLINNLSELTLNGECIGCGKRNSISLKKLETYGGGVSRSHFPLLGSGTLINFYPSWISEADYCSLCIIGVMFMPLVSFDCGDIILIYSQNDLILKNMAKESIKSIKIQLVSQTFSCLNDGVSNIAQTSLFKTLEDIIQKYELIEDINNPSISAYHFTNFGTSPSVRIIELPNPVFDFLKIIKKLNSFNDWNKIVWKGYPFPIKLKSKKKGKPSKENEKIDVVSTIKSRPNEVYNKLIKGESIIKYFIDRKQRTAITAWELFNYYLILVLNMKSEEIDVLKRIADDISEVIKENGTKRLYELERLSYRDYGKFRNILRKIIKDRIALGKPTPLFTLDEYLNVLFPEDGDWSKTHDNLLFRMYEVLHTWFVENKEETPKEEEVEAI